MDMRRNISSGVSKSIFWKIHNKGQMYFCRDVLLGNHKEINEKRLNYCIGEWHTSTPHDIFWNQSNYLIVCLLPYTPHRTNCFITVCGKWIFDSNFEVTFPLTEYYLNYICRVNYTAGIIFLGVLHAIRAVPPKVFQRRLNIK